MTRILLVEDDPTFGAFLNTELAQQERDINVHHIGDRDTALATLAQGVWDLIICDLKIPAETGGLDAAVEHGLAVISDAQRVSPGTPIIVLSAFNTLEIAQRLLRNARQERIYGTPAGEPMLTFFQKSELDSCLLAAKHHAVELLRLGDIEVNGVDSDAERRVLRVFASKHQGDRVRALAIGGGLSSARVLKAEAFRGGAQVARVLARVTNSADADQEIAAYNQFVAPMLPIGLFTPRMPETVIGAGSSVGVFYTLIGTGDVGLFHVLKNDVNLAANLVSHLQQGTTAWSNAGVVTSMKVIDIRRAYIDDAVFGPVQNLLGGCRWADAEARSIQVRRCPQHNDLHGLNVLVDNDRPVLIDYADVGEAPSAFDPVTLELSAFFHPSGLGCRGSVRDKILSGGWWTGAADNTLAPFVQRCRNWAGTVAAGDRERLACAYAYATRQLKYPDTDKELAAAIASTAVNALIATF